MDLLLLSFLAFVAVLAFAPVDVHRILLLASWMFGAGVLLWIMAEATVAFWP